MNKFPLWKYIFIAVVIVLGALYALPNLYGEDPAIQISGTRSAKLTKETLVSVEAALKSAELKYHTAQIDKKNVSVRFADTEIQAMRGGRWDTSSLMRRLTRG